jgi:hypothetical protein
MTNKSPNIPEISITPPSEESMAAVGLSKEIQERLLSVHETVINLLQKGEDAQETLDQFLKSEELNSLDAAQKSWIEQHFSHMGDLQKAREGLKVLENELASMGLTPSTYSKLVEAGKDPLWIMRNLVKSVAYLGPTACLVIFLFMFGGFAEVVSKLLSANTAMLSRNLKAGEEIKEKVEPLEKAIKGLKEGGEAQEKSVKTQTKVGGDAEKIRRSIRAALAADGLQDAYVMEIFEHFTSRALYPIGESALQATIEYKNGEASPENLSNRVNIYLHAWTMFIRQQIARQEEHLDFEKAMEDWIRMTATPMLKKQKKTPETPAQKKREEQRKALREGREFMDVFMQSISKSKLVARKKSPHGVPYQRDFSGVEGSRELLEKLKTIDFSQLKLDLEGLLPYMPGTTNERPVSDIFKMILLGDSHVDARLLKAFERSNRAKTGVMYRVAERYKEGRETFSELKKALGQLDTVVSDEALSEIAKIMEKSLPALRKRREKAIDALEENKRKHIELNEKFQAVKKKYQLDNKVLKACMKFAEWMHPVKDPRKDKN